MGDSSGNEVYGLARKLGGAGRRAALSWQIARALFRLGFAAAMAIFAGEMIEEGTLSVPALLGAIIGLAFSSCAGMFADLGAARAETGVVNGLRTALQGALSRMPPTQSRLRPAGALIAGLQRHPEALSSLVISHAAARSMLGLGPLLAAAAVALVSWHAALTLLLAIPVMIIFFALLGTAVRSRAEMQERAFGRLAAQFADRIRTLPTILANHALGREHGKIERRMTAYADSTMGVLKVAFLNAGVIDFFSALAIALLAVFLGLGHLGLVQVPGFSRLELWQSLFILVIAADFFTPFRRYAEQYHLKAEGEAAAQQLQWYFDDSNAASTLDGKNGAEVFSATGVDKFDAAKLPAAGLIAISGPSGAGKSTLLRLLAGIEPPSSEVAALPQVTTGGCAWIATDIYVPAGSLAGAVAWNRNAVDRAAIRRAAESVGLLDEMLLPGGLDAPIAEGGTNLSGGQRMRIGIARALLAGGIVFADEPTAKLDPMTAKLVRQALVEIALERLVIVATHDDRLIEAADQHHVLHLRNRIDKAVAA
ncbi:MAG TPA: ATP-binding cassette domain-containing protein [Xanthobacteraceae bacterium]|nr:ATP-binding cassette domain-containing protein [Xanthobacteraceae bacterium]